MPQQIDIEIARSSPAFVRRFLFDRLDDRFVSAWAPVRCRCVNSSRLTIAYGRLGPQTQLRSDLKRCDLEPYLLAEVRQWAMTPRRLDVHSIHMHVQSQANDEYEKL